MSQNPDHTQSPTAAAIRLLAPHARRVGRHLAENSDLTDDQVYAEAGSHMPRWVYQHPNGPTIIRSFCTIARTTARRERARR